MKIVLKSCTLYCLCVAPVLANDIAPVVSLTKIERLGRDAFTAGGIQPDTLTSQHGKAPKPLTAQDEITTKTEMNTLETTIKRQIVELNALLEALQRKRAFILATLPIADLQQSQAELIFAHRQMGFLVYEIALCEKLIQAFTTAASLSREAQLTRKKALIRLP